MKADKWSLFAIATGIAAAIAQIMYLAGISPLQADLGIQLSGVLLLLWGSVLILNFVFGRRRTLWVLAITSPALIGPLLFLWTIIACALDSGRCF